jgi:hypothetical protein
MYLHIDDIRQSLEGFRTDYFLVDTPGQIELFAYREPTRDMIQSISLGGSIAIYLFEPLLASTPSGMVSQLTLASSVKYRLDMPFFQVLNKVDLLEEEDLERIMRWVEPDILYSDLTGNQSPNGDSMTTELGVGLFRALEGTGETARFIPSSATTLEGLEDIYSMVQTVFMGGEDLDQQ